ncbi:hypothetical protein [Aquimarina sp. MMG016]|uniref:hypothetical protein n=1 Tax=Aquimarina sp. MMG016 TaxID=2822690 RepID=UPI001B3A6089|nr:hypothetical protein [Aquimarina sp. MMG016]MBQ4820354.1 hypothetical protein [Aquimarina sp. MMG016]
MSAAITSEKEIKKRNKTRIYLIIASSIFGLLILPSLLMIMFSAMMFDSPGSENSVPNITLVSSIITYPIITCIGIVLCWILFVRKKYLTAIIFASIPILNILVGIMAVVYLFVFCDGNFSC